MQLYKLKTLFLFTVFRDYRITELFLESIDLFLKLIFQFC